MKFDDIREGDLIKVSWQSGDLEYTATGVVHEKVQYGNVLRTEDGQSIGPRGDLAKNDYELLEPGLPEENTWVRVRTTYGDTFIGMMQYSHGRKFVETLNTIIEPEEIKDWDVLDWGVGE